MEGDVGHMGGLINPRPGRGQAGFSNTDGSPKPGKRAPCQKKQIALLLAANPTPTANCPISYPHLCTHALKRIY